MKRKSLKMYSLFWSMFLLRTKEKSKPLIFSINGESPFLLYQKKVVFPGQKCYGEIWHKPLQLEKEEGVQRHI